MVHLRIVQNSRIELLQLLWRAHAYKHTVPDPAHYFGLYLVHIYALLGNLHTAVHGEQSKWCDTRYL